MTYFAVQVYIANVLSVEQTGKAIALAEMSSQEAMLQDSLAERLRLHSPHVQCVHEDYAPIDLAAEVSNKKVEFESEMFPKLGPRMRCTCHFFCALHTCISWAILKKTGLNLAIGVQSFYGVVLLQQWICMYGFLSTALSAVARVKQQCECAEELIHETLGSPVPDDCLEMPHVVAAEYLPDSRIALQPKPMFTLETDEDLNRWLAVWRLLRIDCGSGDLIMEALLTVTGIYMFLNTNTFVLHWFLGMLWSESSFFWLQHFLRMLGLCMLALSIGFETIRTNEVPNIVFSILDGKIESLQAEAEQMSSLKAQRLRVWRERLARQPKMYNFWGLGLTRAKLAKALAAAAAPFIGVSVKWLLEWQEKISGGGEQLYKSLNTGRRVPL